MLLLVFFLPLLSGALAIGSHCGGPPQSSQADIEIYNTTILRVESHSFTGYTINLDDGISVDVLNCGPEDSSSSQYAWLFSAPDISLVMYSYGNMLQCISNFEPRWQGNSPVGSNVWPFPEDLKIYKLSCVHFLENKSKEDLIPLGWCPPAFVSFDEKKYEEQQLQFSPGAHFTCPDNRELGLRPQGYYDSLDCVDGSFNLKSASGDVKLNLKEKEICSCQPRPTTTSTTTTTPARPKCPLPLDVPSPEYPAPWVKGGSMAQWNDGANDWINCPGGYIAKLSAASKTFSFGSAYMCDSATGKWIEPGSKYAAPDFMSCGTVPTGTTITYCPITHKPSSGASGSIALYPGHEKYCPTGEIPAFAADGKVIKSITCSVYGLSIVAEDGTVSNPWHPTLQCNNPPSNPECFWSLNYYYNSVRVLHGFCAPTENQGCTQLFNNGLGYDRNTGSGSLGRTITETCFYQMKTTCSENQKNLRRLHFHRVGNHYEHHLPVTADGGIFVGYVALQQGHCGARWPVKAWGCAMSEDVMYAGDLSSNEWYKGRAKYGGVPVFWLW